jgi:hypothetical protein
MRPGLIHFSFFPFSVFILFQTAIVKIFRSTVQRLPTMWKGAPIIMSSCSPLILLGSVPLAHQFELTYPKATDLLREGRPASSTINRTSIIDTQPAKEPTSIPSYRRFDKYANRMSALSHDYVYSSDSSLDTAATQFKRVTSTPVPLKFDFRNSDGNDAPSPETEKGKGKGQCADPTPNNNAVCMSENVFDEDHVVPLRPSHSAKAPPFSAAGPPGSTTNSRHASQDLSLAQFPQVHVLEEGLEARSLHSSVASSVASSPIIRPVKTKDGALTPECVGPSRPPPRLPKRVSFSSMADRGMSAAYGTSQEDSSTPGRMPWGGLALFGKPYVVARPPPSRNISLPSVRGQVAGRSILKRTTSYSDDLTSPHSHEMHSTGMPVHDRIQIDSLKRSSKRTSKRDSAISVLNDVIHSDEFYEIDLSDETLGNAPTVSKDSTVTMSTISPEERTVRPWSMVGSNWIRRSGLFTQAVNVQ